MAWFVILNVSTTAGTGDATAAVVQAADSNALSQKYGVTGSQTGVPGETDAGYATQADAQAAADAFNKSGAGKGAAGAPAAPGSGLTVPGVGSPFQGVTDVAHALAGIGAFLHDAWKKIANGKLWRSLGWVILGILLIIFGLVLWIGRPAVMASPYGRALSAIRQGRV